MYLVFLYLAPWQREQHGVEARIGNELGKMKENKIIKKEIVKTKQ